MKRKMAAFMLAGILALSVCGCGNRAAQSEEEFSFAYLKNKKFYFSSGAGGWATILIIRPDGSFSGEYYDDNMGDAGEDYPNGTRYQAEFNGIFSQPVKADDNAYSMQIKQIQYEQEPETEEIKDGVRYCYGKAHGLDDAGNILLYLPDTPLSELPEGLKSWICSGALWDENAEKLPFYALYNETAQCGFSSSDITEDAKQMLAAVEEQAALLENSIARDPLTQTECNEKTKELYDLWDDALNWLWKSLKETKDSAFMETLTVQEREWISSKEQKIQEAGAGYEGGTMYFMIVNQKAAEITKDRVYELLSLLSV